MKNKRLPTTSVLGNKILLMMTLRISLVFICTCIYAYYHNKNIYDAETLDYAVKYAKAKADLESDYFLNAEANIKIIQTSFLRQVEEISVAEAKQKFSQIIGQDKDTLWRAKGKSADYKNLATIAILPTAKFDDLFYQTTVTAFDVISQYGPAFRNRFFDTYFNMYVNDVNVLYLPETDYSQLTGVKELLVDYDSETGGSPKLNPSRKIFWTNIYFDEAVKKWMLSVSLPVDYKNQWIGCIGHDLLVEDTIKRSEEVSIPGSYNLVFSKKGDLVASKSLKEKIEQSGGQLELNKINDPQIKLIWETVSQKKITGESFRSEKLQAFLGVQKIAGPDWILVQVYPFSLVIEKAKISIITIVLITLLSLLIELYIIYRILNKEVASPLSELISTTTNIYEEPLIHEISIARNDELGVLARSIKSMALEVTENKNNLESKVIARTSELSVSNNLLIEKNIDLDRLNREKNDFLAIANHDLKNPLSMILLGIVLIRKKLDPNTNEKIFEKLDLVENQAKKMMDIIGDYLNYALIEEKNAQNIKEIFNFSELINTIINQHEVALNNKNLKVNKIIEKEVILNTNKSFCGIIFENLLSNAIKYSEPNKEIKIELYQNEKSIFFRVSDEGQGIPMEEQHLVFGKFVKLSTRPTGGENSSGLGLSIVKQLVDRLGAKISFESKPLLGTQFLVEFPKEPS